MNRIWIVCVDGVRVVDAASVQPANRIEPLTPLPKRSCQIATKKAEVSIAARQDITAPLQRGGTLISSKQTMHWSKDDSSEHYRQRCGEHNHRQQACFETKRRRQVVRY